MELTIKGKPNEIAVLLQSLNWQQVGIPSTLTDSELNKWFKNLSIPCSPLTVAKNSELSELSCKQRKEETL